MNTTAKAITVWACLVAAIGSYAYAQTNKTVKNGTASARIISSSKQRTLPGVRGAKPFTNYTFTIEWKSKECPTDFFWHETKDTWASCRVDVKHKYGKSNKILKGDTLIIVPIRNDEALSPIITEIVTPSIVFKTSKKEWLYIPIKDIKSQADIIMP